MRTLIIPDIHHQTAVVDEILIREQHDRVVFLGDYFDSFRDTPDRARRTAEWLKELLRNPRFKLLYGDHDLPYRYGVPQLVCSDFSVEKREAILDLFDREDWQPMRLQASVDGFLITHAGWNPSLVDAQGRITREYIDSVCAECLFELDEGRMHYLVAARTTRGEFPAVGGIVGQDWWELKPVTGLWQIVGHTCV